MSTTQNPPSLWGLLPPSLRSAGIIALVTAVLSAVLLFQTNVASQRPPRFSRGGEFGIAGGGPVRSAGPTSTPEPTARPRTSAVLTAPRDPSDASRPGRGVRFPTFGTYVYSVEGTESATAFGSREYPPEMTMAVRRPGAVEGSAASTKQDELIFDLFFSEEHEEREIVAYREEGILFTYEAGSVTFGPVTQTSEATYTPAMLQIPIPIKKGAVVKGTSRAISPEGEERRIEDWTVTVMDTENIDVMGETVPTWIIEIERQSRPGSAEQVHRIRRYYFDPSRSIWVKWEESMTGEQDFGPGTFTYTTNFTATLDRIEPL